MVFESIVFGFAVVLIILVVFLIKPEETEKHDEAVYYRWEDMEESEPPEWADPVKWWESEEK